MVLRLRSLLYVSALERRLEVPGGVGAALAGALVPASLEPVAIIVFTLRTLQESLLFVQNQKGDLNVMENLLGV